MSYEDWSKIDDEDEDEIQDASVCTPTLKTILSTEGF